MSALIEVENLTFTYTSQSGKPVTALRDVSLTIQEGELVALIGANGSGKTTLARHFNGLHLPTSGTVRVEGLDTHDPQTHQQVQAAVGMVFQNPEDQLVAAVVEEDTAFGPENMGLPPAEIRRRVDEILHEFDLWEYRQRPPHLLSSGQIQRLALAGVLVMQPRCIVFDETTAMLDPVGRRVVMAIIERLHAQGITIVYITHFMGEAARAQRVIVMDRGQVALDGTPQEIFADAGRLAALGLNLPPAAALADDLRKWMVDLPRNLLTTDVLLQALPLYPGLARVPEREPGVRDSRLLDPFIVVEHLGYVYLKNTPLSHRALQDVNLTAGKTEAHGLVGATGSGKSTLLQHLNGLLLPQEGQVTVGQYRLHEAKPDTTAVRRMAGLVFQNPEVQLFEQYVGDEIAYGPRQSGLARAEIRASVQWAMQQVGLDFDAYKDRLTFGLSGGERKKVALASILARRPEVLLLDEPMAGLDPRSRSDLLSALKRLMGSGMTVVLSTHQMEDLAALAQRVTVMQKGRDVLEGPVEEIFARADALSASGLEPPVVTRVADALWELGWPLPAGLVEPASLVNAVKRCVEGARL